MNDPKEDSGEIPLQADPGNPGDPGETASGQSQDANVIPFTVTDAVEPLELAAESLIDPVYAVNAVNAADPLHPLHPLDTIDVADVADSLPPAEVPVSADHVVHVIPEVKEPPEVPVAAAVPFVNSSSESSESIESNDSSVPAPHSSPLAALAGLGVMSARPASVTEFPVYPAEPLRPAVVMSMPPADPLDGVQVDDPREQEEAIARYSAGDVWHRRFNQVAHRCVCLGAVFLAAGWVLDKYVPRPLCLAMALMGGLIAVFCSLVAWLLVRPNDNDTREARGVLAVGLLLSGATLAVTWATNGAPQGSRSPVFAYIARWITLESLPTVVQIVVGAAMVLLALWIGITTALTRRGEE